MLCLKIKELGSVRIGDAVVIVTKIHGNAVRLAIEAPPEVKILRKDLEERCSDGSCSST